MSKLKMKKRSKAVARQDQFESEDLLDDLEVFRNVDLSTVEDIVVAVATEKFEERKFRDRALQRRFNRNKGTQRLTAKRAWKKFQEDTDGEGTETGFLDWLVENWETIFKIIKLIIGAFGGGAVMSPSGQFNQPQRLTRPTGGSTGPPRSY